MATPGMDPRPEPSLRPVLFDQSLETGLPEIDRQHASLIAELNRLIADQPASGSTEVLVDVLSNLGRELDEHFRFEESFFAGLGMQGPEIDAHVAAHGEILSQYVELNLDLMAQSHEHSGARALGQVQQWVLGHILDYDLRMRELLPS
jgi:hemerythrin